MEKQAGIRVVFDRRNQATKRVKGTIEVEILHKGKRKLISTGFRVYKDQWDKKNMVSGLDKQGIEINTCIRNLVSDIQEFINILIKRGEEFSFEKLELFLDKRESQASFLDFMEERIELRSVSESSKRRARSVLKALRKWGIIKNFSDVNSANLKLYDDFAKTKCEEASAVYNYHKHLKTYVLEAYALDLIPKNPYVGFKLTKGEKEIRKFLTPEELNKVETCNIVDGCVSQARDIFVFCCYTGLAYIDLSKFDWNNVEITNGKYRIRDERQKTGSEFNITILTKAYKILEKYNFELPVTSSQKYNIYLKSVGALAKIRKELTSHVARHTFATTVTLANGVRLEAVSKMLGHKHLRTTEIYAKILQPEVDEAFDRLDETFKER